MEVEENRLRHEPRTLCKAYFEIAKRWLLAAILVKFLIFMVGIISVLLPLFPKLSPFLVTTLAITSDLCLWRSDVVKGIAEALLRKLDARDSFGWAISRAEMSDLLIRSPKSIVKLVPPKALGNEYFASKEGLGPRRALENVQESAWWSKHLSLRMGQYCLVIVCLLFLGLISVLIISVETVMSYETLASLGRVVTSSLMLILSLRLLRFVEGYYGFSRKAAQIETSIENLINSQDIETAEAVKIMHEYQLARASAPLIPSWIYNLMQDDLNEMWETYRQQQPVVEG